MRRTSSLSLILIAVAGLSVAQTQPGGGWRRVGDQPPAPGTVVAAPSGPTDQDPSQPVSRSDDYGQPQQQAPAMQRPSEAQAQPYGLPDWVTIPGGTYVTLRTNQFLSSDRNQQGDFFSGTLVEPLVVNGIVLAQRGQTVMGRVAEAQKAGRVSGTSRLKLELTGITMADGTQANTNSSLVSRTGRTDVGRDVGAVAGTTAVGAAIGAAAGWGTGAAIGAGAGAAAGIVGVLLTRGQPTVVYPESVLTFRTAGPINVNLMKAPYAFRYLAPGELEQAPVQVARRPPPPPRPAPYPYYGPMVAAPYPYPYPVPYGFSPYGGVGVGVVIGGPRYWGRRW
jgi:hypothetical protein